MKTIATHRDLVVSYLLALAGVPFPIKPILLPALCAAGNLPGAGGYRG